MKLSVYGSANSQLTKQSQHRDVHPLEEVAPQILQSGQKMQTKLGIGGLENKEKMTSTSDLIASLKKVFGNTELKTVTQCLQKLKQAKDGT